MNADDARASLSEYVFAHHQVLGQELVKALDTCLISHMNAVSFEDPTEIIDTLDDDAMRHQLFLLLQQLHAALEGDADTSVAAASDDESDKLSESVSDSSSVEDEADEKSLVHEIDGIKLHHSRKNATGYTGVYRQSNGQHVARYVKKHLGTFSTAEAAALAYAKERRLASCSSSAVSISSSDTACSYPYLAFLARKEAFEAEEVEQQDAFLNSYARRQPQSPLEDTLASCSVPHPPVEVLGDGPDAPTTLGSRVKADASASALESTSTKAEAVTAALAAKVKRARAAAAQAKAEAAVLTAKAAEALVEAEEAEAEAVLKSANVSELVAGSSVPSAPGLPASGSSAPCSSAA